MKFKTLLFFIVSSTVLFSQESKLKFHSAALMPIGIYFDSETGGVGASIDLSFIKKKNIFRVLYAGGTETGIVFSENRAYSEIDILYGREFLINDWLTIDAFTGLGYFNYNYYLDHVKITNNSIGFPIQSRIRFHKFKTISIGLQLHTNINSIQTVFNIGPFLQWQFKNKSKVDKNSN